MSQNDVLVWSKCGEYLSESQIGDIIKRVFECFPIKTYRGECSFLKRCNFFGDTSEDLLRSGLIKSMYDMSDGIIAGWSFPLYMVCITQCGEMFFDKDGDFSV